MLSAGGQHGQAPVRQSSSTPAARGRPGGERRAARVEAAAGRDPGRVRRLAGQHDRLEVRGLRAPPTAAPGCRGAAGRTAPPRSGPTLDDPAEVHHRDPVGDVPGQAEVVGDDEHRQAELVAQPQQQRQDLAAHRGVQRGHRLVGDEHLGLEDERAGDDDALALAAGQLVRVAQEEALGRAQPGPRQRLGDQLPRSSPAHAVDPQALGHRLVDGVPRVERAGRVLQHQLHLAAVGLQRPAA